MNANNVSPLTVARLLEIGSIDGASGLIGRIKDVFDATPTGGMHIIPKGSLLPADQAALVASGIALRTEFHNLGILPETWAVLVEHWKGVDRGDQIKYNAAVYAIDEVRSVLHGKELLWHLRRAIESSPIEGGVSIIPSGTFKPAESDVLTQCNIATYDADNNLRVSEICRMALKAYFDFALALGEGQAA